MCVSQKLITLFFPTIWLVDVTLNAMTLAAALRQEREWQVLVSNLTENRVRVNPGYSPQPPKSPEMT